MDRTIRTALATLAILALAACGGSSPTGPVTPAPTRAAVLASIQLQIPGELPITGRRALPGHVTVDGRLESVSYATSESRVVAVVSDSVLVATEARHNSAAITATLSGGGSTSGAIRLVGPYLGLAR